MYFADLAPCCYNMPEPKGISIGWLDTDHEFSKGNVPAGFVEHLLEICKKPVAQHRGFHVCEFCDFGVEPDYQRAKAEGALSSMVIQVVSHDGTIYYSPAMICHYISKHGYQPPEDFVRAVMESKLDSKLNKPQE